MLTVLLTKVKQDFTVKMKKKNEGDASPFIPDKLQLCDISSHLHPSHEL